MQLFDYVIIYFNCTHYVIKSPTLNVFFVMLNLKSKRQSVKIWKNSSLCINHFIIFRFYSVQQFSFSTVSRYFTWIDSFDLSVVRGTDNRLNGVEMDEFRVCPVECKPANFTFLFSRQCAVSVVFRTPRNEFYNVTVLWGDFISQFSQVITYGEIIQVLRLFCFEDDTVCIEIQDVLV